TGFIGEQACRRAGIAGELLGKPGRPDVEPVRPTVVAQVPDHLGALDIGGGDLVAQAAPVVASRRLPDAMPAYPIADGAHSMPGHCGVVAIGPSVVPRRSDQIQPAAVRETKAGALEARLDEAPKRRAERQPPHAASTVAPCRPVLSSCAAIAA